MASDASHDAQESQSAEEQSSELTEEPQPEGSLPDDATKEEADDARSPAAREKAGRDADPAAAGEVRGAIAPRRRSRGGARGDRRGGWRRSFQLPARRPIAAADRGRAALGDHRGGGISATPGGFVGEQFCMRCELHGQNDDDNSGQCHGRDTPELFHCDNTLSMPGLFAANLIW